jgi:hypothetical protein
VLIVERHQGRDLLVDILDKSGIVLQDATQVRVQKREARDEIGA